MKTILLAMSLLFSYTAFGQITKTIYKTYSKIEDVSTLNLIFGYETEVEEWSERRILVETTIKMTSANKNILKFLVESGRYEMEEEIGGGSINLKFKDALDETLVVRGTEIWEDLSIVVFAPKKVTVNVTPPPPKPDPEDYADEDYSGEEGEDYGYDDEGDGSDQVDENINYFDMYTPDEPTNYDYDPGDDYDYGPSSDDDQVEPPKLW